MKKFLATILLSSTLLIAVAAVIDISGKWTGTLHLDDGSEPAIHYNFTVTGDKLTGDLTTAGADGTFKIENGKITGDSLKFTVNYNGDDIPNYGKIFADSISLNAKINDNVFHVQLKRDK